MAAGAPGDYSPVGRRSSSPLSSGHSRAETTSPSLELPSYEENSGSGSQWWGALPSWVFVTFWIGCSSTVIMLQKYILYDLKFAFPVFLTTWHMVFATVTTQLLARFTPMLDSRHDFRLSGKQYLHAIVPISVAFSAGLIFNNSAYLLLSVSFIQMLKATTPVVVLLGSWFAGTQEINFKMMGNVYVIVIGVIIASWAEVAFRWNGFISQVMGIMAEALRLVLIEKLLNKPENKKKMEPMVMLYFYAPVCVVCNFVVYLMFEATSLSGPELAKVGFALFFFNGLIAFVLNIAVLLVISKTSGVTYTLCGVLKDILLVVLDIITHGTHVRPLQFVGYGIALIGLIIHKTGTDIWRQHATRGVNYYTQQTASRPVVRKAVTAGAGSLLFLISLIIMLANKKTATALTPQDMTHNNSTLTPVVTIPRSRPYLDLDYTPSRKFDIVVSMYNDHPQSVRDQVNKFRDSKTIKHLNPSITIYVKDATQNLTTIQSVTGARMVKLVPNVGREGDTYLYHILHEWDDLAEHTLFIQGDTHFIDKAINRLNDYYTPQTGVLSLGFTHFDCKCHDCKDPWGGDGWPRVPQIYSAIHNELCPTDNGLLISYTGQFVASAKRIRGGPRSVYKHLFSLVEADMDHWIHEDPRAERFHDTTDNPFFGHTLERSWLIMFQCNDVSIAKGCGNYEDRRKKGDPDERCQCLDKVEGKKIGS